MPLWPWPGIITAPPFASWEGTGILIAGRKSVSFQVQPRVFERTLLTLSTTRLLLNIKRRFQPGGHGNWQMARACSALAESRFGGENGFRRVASGGGKCGLSLPRRNGQDWSCTLQGGPHQNTPPGGRARTNSRQQAVIPPILGSPVGTEQMGPISRSGRGCAGTACGNKSGNFGGRARLGRN